MIAQDKQEEIQTKLAQLGKEGENYRDYGWGATRMNRAFIFLKTFIALEPVCY
jgi:hypothetical protein